MTDPKLSALQRKRSKNSPWRRWKMSPESLERAKKSGYVPPDEQ